MSFALAVSSLESDLHGLETGAFKVGCRGEVQDCCAAVDETRAAAPSMMVDVHMVIEGWGN